MPWPAYNTSLPTEKTPRQNPTLMPRNFISDIHHLYIYKADAQEVFISVHPSLQRKSTHQETQQAPMPASPSPHQTSVPVLQQDDPHQLVVTPPLHHPGEELPVITTAPLL